jgi:hypothetical protein
MLPMSGVVTGSTVMVRLVPSAVELPAQAAAKAGLSPPTKHPITQQTTAATRITPLSPPIHAVWRDFQMAKLNVCGKPKINLSLTI